MHPPWSMIFFTTLSGAAQGLLLALVGWEIAAAAPASRTLYAVGAVIALALGGIALAAATFHLGHPLRAWRAAAMWRTSWLSREVIVLPVFLALVAAWGAMHWAQAPVHGGAPTVHWAQAPTRVLGLIAATAALALYLCTGMIYAAVRAMREWAHPITPINFLVLGAASGALLAAAVAAWVWPPATDALARASLAFTLLGAATRGWALWRNLVRVPATTPQSAIGVRHPQIRQTSQGATGGTFNSREFFHQRSDSLVSSIRLAAAALAFVVPAAALAAGVRSAMPLAMLFVVQFIGLLAERWSFFAEAQHPQNVYQRATT